MRGSECTSRYVEQLASKQAKKKTGLKRRRKSSDEGEEREGAVASRPQSTSDLSDGRNGIEVTPGWTALAQDALVDEQTIAQPRHTSSERTQPTQIAIARPTQSSAMEKQDNLLGYLFAPEPVLDDRYGYTDNASIRQCESRESDLWEEMGGEVWRERASTPHLEMDRDAINEYVSRSFGFGNGEEEERGELMCVAWRMTC